jgi:formate hydrogenlyase subunit 3/multisubunit Na+/H+ antiporter MnhD subunit
MPSEKRNILTGGLILITLGVLIFIGRTTSYHFGQTWPILIIVIGISTIIQRAKDFGGWFITIAGVVFLFINLYGFDLSQYSHQYLLPAVLILLGIFVILRRKKK